VSLVTAYLLLRCVSTLFISLFLLADILSCVRSHHDYHKNAGNMQGLYGGV
jgi:hypothetical protein